MIEGWRTWAKDYMRRTSVTIIGEIISCYSRDPRAIKTSGLAAEKGVIIAESPLAADGALGDILIRSKFGSAGTAIVRDEYLNEEEITIPNFSDEIATRTLPSSQIISVYPIMTVGLTPAAWECSLQLLGLTRKRWKGLNMKSCGQLLKN